MLILLGCQVTAANASSVAILDHNSLSAEYYGSDSQWYKENVPFFECSDTKIQQIYYYRWKLYKSHFRNIGTKGYIVTEFLNRMPWDVFPYDSINDSAGHHIYEGRWIKDRRYLDDYLLYMYKGGGNNPRYYSECVADAAWARYLVNMDSGYIKTLLPYMEFLYSSWSNFDKSKGLYHIIPCPDATEYTIGSIDASGGKDGFWGGDAFRPSVNSYQYANAMAVAKVAALTGDTAAAKDYQAKAASLKENMQNSLWNPSFQHFIDRYFETNQYVKYWDFIRGRELVGYLPWAYNIPDNNAKYTAAWQHLMDPNKFYGAYGLRTNEPSYQYYMKQYRYDGATKLPECQWNGPSWPYQETQVLMGMANVLNNYSQTYISKSDYIKVLKSYTLQHFYKDGFPNLLEDYNPDKGGAIVDLPERSQHYNHSAYNDLIITGLCGLRPRADNILQINPLIPLSPKSSGYISYYCIDNISYHGHMITILFDSTGAKYRKGKGLSVFVDNKRVIGPAPLGNYTAKIPAPVLTAKSASELNRAINLYGWGSPTPEASAIKAGTNLYQAIDGRIWYWTNTSNKWAGSNGSSDWYAVDFGSAYSITKVKLYFYDDGAEYKAPANYNIQFWNGKDWADIPAQSNKPLIPVGNTVNTVTFTPVTTQKIRAVFENAKGKYTALAEFEAIDSTSYDASNNGLQYGHIYKLQNVNSNKLLSIQNGSNVVQSEDSNIGDQEWLIELCKDGYCKLINKGSNKALGIENQSGNDSANATLSINNNTKDTEWLIIGNPNLPGSYKLVNRISHKVLGVTAMSKDNGARVIQYGDNGSADHDWIFKLIR